MFIHKNYTFNINKYNDKSAWIEINYCYFIMKAMLILDMRGKKLMFYTCFETIF
jgi:hypothetical protein